MSSSPHTIEPAATSRSRCRGCGEAIGASVLRFGESLPNPFGEGETRHWFHLDCAAFRRPEAFLPALDASSAAVEDAERLREEAKRGVDHPRLARVNGAERDPSGRAQCRSCRTSIAKGAWRIPLVFYEDGRFMPSGFIHARCARAYFGTIEVMPRIRRFSKQLSEAEEDEIRRELEQPSPESAPDPESTS